MYAEAISHVQMEGHVKDEGTIMKFEDAIPQPLAHTVHGKERYDGGTLGHHFDIHKAEKPLAVPVSKMYNSSIWFLFI